MKYVTSRALQHSSFLLALLLHLLILFSMTAVWVANFKPAKSPSMYVPSYVYQEPTKPTPPAPSPQPQKKTMEQPEPQKQTPTKAAIPTASNSNVVKIKNAKTTEPIHLVGDKNTTPKPLIKMLGKALAQHLVYPKAAVDFHIRGMVYVGFVLHPDGQLTNVKVVQSSKAGVLDNEAVSAVSAISPLKNVKEFVQKPEYMVVGIIFN